MRIGLDLRPFLKEETGIGVYFKNLLYSLAQIDQKNEYFLFSASWKDRFPREKVPYFSGVSFQDFRFPVGLMDKFWYTIQWPTLDVLFHSRLDLTHSPTPLVLPTRGKKIVTIHDLFFWDHSRLTDEHTQRTFLKRAFHSLRQADGVIVVSRFVKDEVLKKFALDEAKVKVIYHGVPSQFLSKMPLSQEKAVREKFKLPAEFIMYVGTIEPRKNLTTLIQALRVVHDEHGRIPLVIVGRKGTDFQNVMTSVRQNNLESGVRILDYISDEEVRVLYSLASVFVLPSWYEGFGIPLLEAMASDVAVVCSEASALPEVAQDAALYFDPYKPDDAADCIIRVLRDESLRDQLIARGRERIKDFRWEKAAAETLQFYQTVVKGES